MLNRMEIYLTEQKEFGSRENHESKNDLTLKI